MLRVLALYYSQTGQLRRALESLLAGLDPDEFEVHVEAIRPVEDYPFPWPFGEFLDVFPDCVLGRVPEIHKPGFDPDADYDLIVLGYTVWFLAPSLPLQGFLKSEHARVLRGKSVTTLIACRNMWHTASERMKRDLAAAGAELRDNVVVTDEGPAWATFVTTPRWMFTGRKGRFWKVFPPAGVSADSIAGLRRFGEAITQNRGDLGSRSGGPLLTGLGAIEIDNRMVVPELLGRVLFQPWSRLVAVTGGRGGRVRRFTLYLFFTNLVLTVLILVPISVILRLLLYPLIRAPLQAYVGRLKAPSGDTSRDDLAPPVHDCQ
jgi:hypothetical protein